MFFVPGKFIAVLTFPGVIVHELAHQFFCYLCHIPVYEVKYFQFKNPNGYVIHEKSNNPLSSFVISIGPFLINTLLGAFILFPATIENSVFGISSIALNNVTYWLGLSIIMHAFPSIPDAKVLVQNILKNNDVNILIKILVSPFIGLIYLGAAGSVFWLDLGYAILISQLIPKIIAQFI